MTRTMSIGLLAFVLGLALPTVAAVVDVVPLMTGSITGHNDPPHKPGSLGRNRSPYVVRSSTQIDHPARTIQHCGAVTKGQGLRIESAFM